MAMAMAMDMAMDMADGPWPPDSPYVADKMPTLAKARRAIAVHVA